MIIKINVMSYDDLVSEWVSNWSERLLQILYDDDYWMGCIDWRVGDPCCGDESFVTHSLVYVVHENNDENIGACSGSRSFYAILCWTS